MKAIINGLRYDTEKSVCIGAFDNLGHWAESTRDFHFWEARLYKTPRSGRYFLAGEGGPVTEFSHSISQNSWSGGSKIIPMDEQEAFRWAERYLDPDVIEEYFGHLVEEA